MSGANGNNEAEMKRVLQELGTIARRLDILLMPGQMVKVNVPTGNIITIGQKGADKSIIVMSKPAMTIEMDIHV